MFAPRKFTIMLYADDTRYYVVRYGWRMTGKKAEATGVQINGKTGLIERTGNDLKPTKKYEELKKMK